MPNSMSEDELFKALLKKKPEAQVPVRKEVLRPAPAAPAAQPAESYEKQEPVIETNIAPPVKPMEIELAIESIKNLNASVNMLHGLIKTVIVPVLVLILIVIIAILVKS